MAIFLGHFGAASNKAHWSISMGVKNQDGTDFDWSAVSEIVIAVMHPETKDQVLRGALSDAKVTVSATPGFISWLFTPSEMTAVAPGTYSVGLAYKRTSDGIVVTHLIGDLPVLDGVAEIP